MHVINFASINLRFVNSFSFQSQGLFYYHIHPFSTNGPLLGPLKTSESQRYRFSGGIKVEH